MARARRARLPGRRQRLGQDDPGRDAGRRARARPRASCAAATTSSVGYLSQHPEVAGDAERHRARRTPSARPGSRRRRRGRCSAASCSRGEDVAKPLADISGGEAQRLALALLTQLRRQPAGPRRADQPPRPREPRGARGRADARFAGTVLLVSHDRALLEAVGSRTLVIEDGALRSHPGGWAEYRALGRGRSGRRAPPAPRAEARPPARGRRAEQEPQGATSRGSSARSRRPRRRFKRLEDELADPSHWADPRRSARATQRHEAAPRRSSTRLMARWEAAAERVEGLVERLGQAQSSCIGGLVCDPPGRMRCGSGAATSAGCSTPSSSPSSPESSISSTMSPPPTSSPLT